MFLAAPFADKGEAASQQHPIGVTTSPRRPPDSTAVSTTMRTSVGGIVLLQLQAVSAFRSAPSGLRSSVPSLRPVPRLSSSTEAVADLPAEADLDSVPQTFPEAISSAARAARAAIEDGYNLLEVWSAVLVLLHTRAHAQHLYTQAHMIVNTHPHEH